jgi:hypothetical protein
LLDVHSGSHRLVMAWLSVVKERLRMEIPSNAARLSVIGVRLPMLANSIATDRIWPRPCCFFCRRCPIQQAAVGGQPRTAPGGEVEGDLHDPSSSLHSLLHLIPGKARAFTAADAGSIFLVERAAPARFGMVGAPAGEGGVAEVGAAEGGLAEDRLWFAVSQNASIEARRADGIEPQVHDIRFPLSP